MADNQQDLGLPGEEQEAYDELERFKRVWRNEKCAPVLLPHEKDLLEKVRQYVREQEEFLEEEAEKHQRIDATKALMLNMLRMDVERCNYLVRSYLRTRLLKIQKLYQSLLTDDQRYNLMSREEQRFCRSYADLVGKHFHSCVLDRLPENLRGMANEEMIAQPPLDDHVFVSVLEDIPDPVHIESEAVEMKKDETFVIRFRHIEQLVTDQKIQLV
uniref:DNA replication complex GINS protein SLD5 n=1 Tax=Hemiselmis andersenii TaxID=464988 RepID=A0A7S1DHH6_HEMAN